MDFPATVAPFILRGVTLYGIDSVMAPRPLRLEAWSRLARDLDPAKLETITREIPQGAISTRRVDGGIFLWCRLGHGLSGRTLLREAAAAGVTFAAGEHFYADDAGGDEIRLCFSSVSPIRIGEGMRRLGEVIRRESAGSPRRSA